MAETKDNGIAREVIVLIVALVIVAVFLLTPVKGWLNSNPLVFTLIFLALLVFSAYGLVMSLRDKESWRSWLAWGLALVAALLATVWAFGAGVIFLTIARYAAMLFVALEVILTVLDIISSEQA